MGKLRLLATSLLCVAALSACADEPTTPGSTPVPVTPSAEQLDAFFDEAARDFGVPAGLLKSIGYVETRWQMVRGESEFPGQEPAYGVMALRGENLRQGAALAKLDER